MSKGFYWLHLLLLQTLLFLFSGRAAVTLTSSVEHDAACPGEVVVHTCTAPRTSSVSWSFPPDIDEFDYFPSSPIGQVRVIGDSRVVLTDRVLDPNNARLADLTTTVTVTATSEQNGRILTCEGDEPSERLSLILNVTSLPSPPQTPRYTVQHYGPHNVTVTVQWGYPEFDGGAPVNNFTINGTSLITTTSQVNETTLTLPYSVRQNIGVTATNCNGTSETATFTYYEAGCEEPIPPSGMFIDGFQSAAEGSTIAYSCSPGLVPTPQMSVCTNMTWRPDPATLQCREPLSRESVDMAYPTQTTSLRPTPTPSSTPTPNSTSNRPGSTLAPQVQPWLIPVVVICGCVPVVVCVAIIIIGVVVGLKRHSEPHEEIPTESNVAYGHSSFITSGSLPNSVKVKSYPSALPHTDDTDLPPPIPPKLFLEEELFPPPPESGEPHWNVTPLLPPKPNLETPHPPKLHQHSGEQLNPAPPPLPPKSHLKSTPESPPPRPPKSGSSSEPTT